MGSQLFAYVPYPTRPASKKQQEWWPVKGEYQPDGTVLLKVDTELELDAGNIYINNLKVGSVDQTKTNVRFLKVLDDGTVVTMSNPTQFYRIADTDDPTTGNNSGVNYYGFTDLDGNWYILKEDLTGATGTYRYIKGATNYSTNWTNRGTLVGWDYFHNIF